MITFVLKECIPYVCKKKLEVARVAIQVLVFQKSEVINRVRLLYLKNSSRESQNVWSCYGTPQTKYETCS